MAKYKDFTKKIELYPSEKTTLEDRNKVVDNRIQIPPTNTLIVFPKNTTARKSFNFHKFYGKNCDEIVFACQQQIQCFLETSINTNGQTLSIGTIVSYCREGITSFLSYCAVMASSLREVLTLTDIDKSFMEKYIEYLKNAPNFNRSTPRTYYTSIKQVLFALGKKKLVSQDIFPRNPYPNSNHLRNAEIALSSKERNQLAYALKSELKILLEQTQKGINSYDASICLLAIAMRTGRNTTPLLELSLNCLQEHPLKPDRKLLVSYKRRGSSTHLTTLRKNKNIEIMATVMPDVDAIVQKLIELNEPIRELAPKEYRHRLFLYKKSQLIANAEENNILPLTADVLANAIKKLIRKHNLISDDGMPLKLNISRLRKTFVNRLWQLSGNDPFVTAKLAGHTLKVSNDHYLEVSKEMIKDWRLMGEIRTAELLENKGPISGNNSLENTPVGHCKDTKFGHLAPKNGEYCSNFLGCFRCPSYVITGDDLHRLFSFYWLLVREREQIGVRKWSRYYAHIIRIIDRQIAPQFEANKVAQNRSLAKETPHPFWRNREQLLESV